MYVISISAYMHMHMCPCRDMNLLYIYIHMSEDVFYLDIMQKQNMDRKSNLSRGAGFTATNC